MQARLLKSISTLYKGSILNKTTIFSLTPLSRSKPRSKPPHPPLSVRLVTKHDLLLKGQEGRLMLKLNREGQAWVLDPAEIKQMYAELDPPYRLIA